MPSLTLQDLDSLLRKEQGIEEPPVFGEYIPLFGSPESQESKDFREACSELDYYLKGPGDEIGSHARFRV